VEAPQQASGRPGFRAPHAWVTRDGTRLSTVELFGDGWVLISGRDGVKWVEAARQVSTDLGVRLDTYGVGAELASPGDELADRYGIGSAGASLVRPDGVVAWRTDAQPDDPGAVLRGVLTRVLSR
jgi:aklavinone 12-hydroxylase